MTLRTRITATTSGMTVLGITLFSLLASWQVNEYVERRMEEALTAQLTMIGELLDRGHLAADSTADDDTELDRIARELNARLTFVRSDGAVLYDSDVPRDSLAALENHAARPEFRQARAGRIGTDRRASASTRHDFLYAARRISRPGSPLDSGYVRLAIPLTEIEHVDRQVQTIIWAIGALAILVTVLVSIQLSRRIAQPIMAIAATAQEIKSGRLDRRCAVMGKDEIGALAVAINELADALSADITRLKRLERVRSEFLANVSHELRTPIFSVQGFLETLLDGALDDPGVNRDFLEKAHSHAQRLNALLNDLIELSRIESGEMKMSYRYFPVSPFVRGAVEEHCPQAEQAGITLRYDAGVPDDLMVFGDRERLHQVMVNLIDNALKYTGRGGTVVCRTIQAGNSCEVQVQDNGCGIAPEHQARVFERFYRVDKNRSREAGGTGLGLAIVKHIVEAHGANVELQSSIGAGSTFSFRLRT